MNTVSRKSKALRFAIVASLLGCAASVRADGPGLPNNTYTSAQLYTTLSAFDSTNFAPQGHGFVSMHRGYLVVLCAKDGGGGEQTGNFSLYDISNPSSPVCVFTTVNNPNYSTNSGHTPESIREAHSIAFSGDYMAVTSSGTTVGGVAENGIQIWKLTNVDKPSGVAANAWFGPERVAMLPIPTASAGDYSLAPWSLTWIGRYIYVAVPGRGLAVIDAADPTAPVMVNRGTGNNNPLKITEIGGTDNGLHQIVGVGPNILQGRNNLTSIDVSDPINPKLVYDNSTDPGYSIQRYGDRAFGFQDKKITAYNTANLSSIVKLSDSTISVDGGYGIVQDGILHFGGGSKILRGNITGNAPYTFTETTPTKPANRASETALFKGPDWDFYTPLGNLAFLGNDHKTGSALIVNSTAKDTTPPAVVLTLPKNNATNVPVTSPIGIQFSDQFDGRTITSSNIYLRKVGTTAAIAARMSHILGVVNLTPNSNLEGNTTYEIVVTTGVKDLAGNNVAAQVVNKFSTGNSIVSPTTPLTAALTYEQPAVKGTSVTFDVTTSGGTGTVDVLWDWGDGTTTDSNTTLSASKTYANAGLYNVRVTVTRGSESVVSSQVFVAHNALTTNKPTYTSTIIYDDATTDKVWVVNTDSNTISSINPTSGAKINEAAAGTRPRTLAKAPNGQIWVANEGSDTITVHNASDGAVANTINLPRGSAPFGILFSPDGANAYVSLGGSWEVAKINPSTRVVSTPVSVGPYPRGLAMTGDSARLFVTRFISTATQGEVYELNPSTLAAVRTLTLAEDTTVDSESNGRGVPNYLISPVISPDGTALAVPSTKANTARGTRRDGLALDHDNTVRTITSFLDLANNTEFSARREDLNDRDSAVAGAYSPLGNYLFVVTQGSNTLEVLNAYTGDVIASFLNTGRAPRGIALNPDGTRAYVQNFMDRTVKVYNISEIINSGVMTATEVATTDVVTTELLSATVLKGKQIFYNAADSRMSQDKYLSCASCHTDAGQDGRIWDFTNRGEGFRNTIDLNGRSGMGHGLVHWSANFDEIQDFENDIRNHQGGTGFMTTADFNATSDTLGAKKAGKSTDLDALAAYVASLDKVDKSPFRASNGDLSAEGVAGKAVFDSVGCAVCHIPSLDFRDGLTHNVGTINADSGKRLNATLSAIDTPALIGLWNTAPYFHNGTAATLADTLTAAHAGVTLTAAQKTSLVDYLLELEDGVETAPAAPSSATAATGTATGSIVVSWTDNSNNEVDFHLQRRQSGTTAWTTVNASIPANSTSFTDTGLLSSTTYEYQVRSETETLFSAWVSAGSATTATPPAITTIDNDTPGYSATGTTWTLATGSGYVGTDYRTSDTGVATYAPALSDGEYEVEVKFTTGWTQLRSNVPHTVNHVNGVTAVAVDQTSGNVWVKLGTFTMNSTSTVVIGRPATGRPCWDAVRFTKLAGATAPTITDQPDSVTVAAGGSATFTVVASGTAPFTYQWKKGTTNISGATSDTLTLSNVQSADAGDYTVVVTNSVNSVTSSVATLTVTTSGGGGTAVIIDSSDTTKVTTSGGTWYSVGAGTANGGTFRTIANTAAANLTWTPGLAGSYFIEVWHPTTWSRLSPGAKFTVNHSGGATQFTVNQQTNGGTWFRLGTAALTLTTTSTVVINGAADQDSDNTAEYPVADAIRLVPAN